MSKQPFFSIALPTYNRAQDLGVAIRFILAQTFKDFEIVISDNASTDKTKEVVRSFNDPRIKYFRTKKNTEVMPNVRRAIKLSKGKYIFLHGDDDFIFEKPALKEVYRIITKNRVGFVRLNYLSLSSDIKYIFDYRGTKGYRGDVLLKPKEKNLKTINFLLKADPSFLTGNVFKNDLPKEADIIESELYSWFPIIFYCSQEYGAYYLNHPFIVAGWSEWRVRINNFNPLYSIRNGELTSERFFEFIKGKISEKDYSKFIIEKLDLVYVKRFMVIKLFTGSDNTIQIAKRLLVIEPYFKIKLSFWIRLTGAVLTPRAVLEMLRRVYLFIYINRSKLNNRNALEIINQRNVFLRKDD